MANFEKTVVKNKEGVLCWVDRASKKTLAPTEMDATAISAVLARLAHYESAQEKGKLVVFPSGIDETVYLRHVFQSSCGGAENIVAVPAKVCYLGMETGGKQTMMVKLGTGVAVPVGVGDFFESEDAAVNKETVKATK